MFKNLHMSHVTGSAEVVENRLMGDVLRWDRTPFTAGQMFFKPYESKEEFIFCARNTVQPLLILGLAILDPFVLVTVPTVFCGLALGAVVVAGFSKLLGDDDVANFALDFAEDVLTLLCQAIINLMVLPLSALALITRSVSTGLKAAGICDYDAPEDDQNDQDDQNYQSASELSPSSSL
jgi:hypothetical protein